MANVVSRNVLFRTFPVACGAGVVVDSNFLILSVVQQQQFVDDDDGCVLDNILETSARDVLEPWFRSLSFMYGQWAMGIVSFLQLVVVPVFSLDGVLVITGFHIVTHFVSLFGAKVFHQILPLAVFAVLDRVTERTIPYISLAFTFNDFEIHIYIYILKELNDSTDPVNHNFRQLYLNQLGVQIPLIQGIESSSIPIQHVTQYSSVSSIDSIFLMKLNHF